MFNGTRDNVTTTHLPPNIGGINERVHPERTHLPERAAHWLPAHVAPEPTSMCSLNSSPPTGPAAPATRLTRAVCGRASPQRCSLHTIVGRTPNSADCHNTRSAILPTSTEPISRSRPVRDCWTDRVLGDVAAGAVVVVAAVTARVAPQQLHLMCGLPGADHHLADAAHRLGVRADDRQGADVLWRHKRRERASSDGIGSCYR